MNKLELYVCSNLCPEINYLLTIMDYPAVTVIEYPCACLINDNHNIISTLLQNNEYNSADKVIICSKTCGIFKFYRLLMFHIKLKPWNIAMNI